MDESECFSKDLECVKALFVGDHYRERLTEEDLSTAGGSGGGGSHQLSQLGEAYAQVKDLLNYASMETEGLIEIVRRLLYCLLPDNAYLVSSRPSEDCI